MAYRCEATSVTGFVQQIACCYLRHGYWWYVTGRIPHRKDPATVDEKLIDKYGIDISESSRARRKRAGFANLAYIRHDRFFVLLATKGRHAFYEQEATNIRDIRRVPLKYAGYSISYRPGGRTRKGERDARWHAHVQIERRRFKELQAYLLELAAHRRAGQIVQRIYEIPYEPYAPIRRQMLLLLKRINQVRKRAGFQAVPTDVLPLRRRVVRPFE